VWLISGETPSAGARLGKRKRFFLHYWFTATRVQDGTAEQWPRICGTYGRYSKEGGVPLNDYPWFKPLYMKQALYARGLQRLCNEKGHLLVEALEHLDREFLTDRGHATP